MMMDFKVGDSVLVIDEDLSGIIKKITDNSITIETKDGFLLDFNASEIVKNRSTREFRRDMFSHSNINDVISEKEKPLKKKTPSLKVKERYEPTMEVDLHINQLVNSPKGMSNHEMLTLQLETARRQLDFAIKKRIQKVVFIHGVGEGVLKIELDYLFARYNNVKFYDANYQKYGLGATEVYIYQNSAPND
tara:strand:- start:423 stop:995 length:573 start_codon:yes stop_codon:yes gene_type:complete